MRICSICKVEKDDTEFYCNPKTGQFHSFCHPCRKAWNKDREKKHPGDAAKRQKRYRDSDPMRERGNVYRWRSSNRHVVNGYMQQARDAALLAYGGFKCACCGETQKMFLALDHVNNDGANDRRNNGGSTGLYYWLKRNNYPPGFQVLCHNCNWGKYVNGGVCPHVTDLEGSTTKGENPVGPSGPKREGSPQKEIVR